MRRFLIGACTLSIALLGGCGGSGNGSDTRVTDLTLTPNNVIVRPGASRGFVYNIQGVGTPDLSVNWTTDSGQIDNNGVYTAPATEGIAHVTVRSVADSTKSAISTITVSSTAGPTFVYDLTKALSLKNHYFVVAPSGAFELGQAVTVTGTANTGITYSVTTPGGGSIDASGHYTAPTTAGNYPIKLTSSADTTQTDYVYAVVQPNPAGVTGTITISAPRGADGNPLPLLNVGQTYRFGYSLTVNGSTNNTVTWSVTNGATIGADGSFRASAPGTYTVTVTSAALGRSASTTVTAG